MQNWMTVALRMYLPPLADDSELGQPLSHLLFVLHKQNILKHYGNVYLVDHELDVYSLF